MEDDPHDSSWLEAAPAMEEDQVTTVSLGPMGPVFQQLRSAIASLQESRGLRLKGVKAEIQILGQGLERLCSDVKVFSEAEDNITRCWVSQVRDLLYDTVDYLDEVIHYSSGTHLRIRSENRGSKSFRVSRRLTWFSLPKVRKLKRVTMIAKLSALVARVEDAEERRERFNLSPPEAIKRDYAQDAPILSHIMPQLPPQLHVDRLVELLALNDDDDNDMEKKLKTVTIFGSAGVDKTSIARSLYHQYGGRFEHRAFLRVSRDPDTRRLLAKLLSQIKEPPAQAFSDVKQLTSTITKHLQGKSYLIIIDDLWDASTWDIISRALPNGDNCRIITATQIQDVALACCSYQLNHIYEITPLNGDQSGESESDCTAYPSSEGMKEAINVVYNNLPPHLKTCLLYLNMYLEGYTIRKDELVNQWVAEGFIGSVQGQDIETTAGCYFDALVSCGLVQSVDTNHNGEVLSCTLHHMVLDLIRQKSMEENFVTIVNYFQTILGLPDKVRRLSVQLGGAKGANNVPENMRISQVRSLLFSGFFKRAPSTVHYGLLQVLILHIWSDKDEIFDLPTIGELYRLRYLKIECNMTVKLPENIRRLRHLGTLQVDARLFAVPSGIVHLQKLLHLRLLSESILPHGVGRMTCLRTLGYFDLGRNSEDNVRDLGELKNLQDLQLTCSTVQPAESLENNMLLLGSVLKKLSILRSVSLVPATGSCNVNTLQHDAGVSKMCIPCDGFSTVFAAPVHLQTLELSRHCCIFSRLPKWLGELTKLRILKIAVGELLKEDIDILKKVPALTALSLHLPTMSADRIVFDKRGFSVLTYFKFTCTVPWLKLEADAMPNLKKLKLCFNAPIVDEQRATPIIIEHLSSRIREISAKICSAGVDSRSALLKAIRNDPRNPEVQLIASIYCDVEGRGMVTREGSVEDENNETHTRARAHLPSPSSSPLPAFSPRSPQREMAERMLTHGGSWRSSSSSASVANRSASPREIDEEATILKDEDDDGGGKLYVAVGKDIKDGRSNLVWAARNLLAGYPKLVLLHVHQPADIIMIGLCKVPVRHVKEKELKEYRKVEKKEMNTLLNQYLNFCRVSLKMQAETLVIEKNSCANGIIELIDRNHITKLVMGTASCSVRRKVPKSKVAASVHRKAKPYCQIFYICKENLACSRRPLSFLQKLSHPKAAARPPSQTNLSSLQDPYHSMAELDQDVRRGRTM